MDPHALQTLDYGRIRETLAGLALTPGGRAGCLELEPAGTVAQTVGLLDEIDLLEEAEQAIGPVPLGSIFEIEPHLEASSLTGGCLDVEQLLEVRDTVKGIGTAVEWVEDCAAEELGQGDWSEGVDPLYELADRFGRTFGSRGEILDTASPGLKSLRAEIRNLRALVAKRLEAIVRDRDLGRVVRDDFITQRSNRFVIPLLTNFRGSFEGIIHDRSRTGETVFVEPLEVVETNNRFNIAKEEEAAEIRRILLALTAEVGGARHRISSGLKLVTRLDMLSARLKLAAKLNCARPVMADGPILDLKGARHPLLALNGEGEVFPIDVRLGEGAFCVLVTGANAGGKTVALKTAGLLTLMARSGLRIPADEGSEVGWFERILTDIGDEQDIDKGLSTFSAHVANLRDILNTASTGDLVLLDELGTGTDPSQGGALAAASLETLIERGTRIMATTHLDGLKTFAYTQEGALNAAVAFEPETGKPLYKLLYGQAGSSAAFDVADRMGFPPGVVARARALAGGGSDTAELLGQLERARDEARANAEEAAEQVRNRKHMLELQKALLEEAKRERNSAREEARGEALKMIDDAKRELNRVIDALAKGKVEQKRAQEKLRLTRDRLGLELGGRERKGRIAPTELEAGTKVLVATVGKPGEVETVDAASNKVVVRIGTLRMAVPASSLEKIAPSGKVKGSAAGHKKAVKVDADRGLADVNVIGKTVDEALAEVDRALNKALISGMNTFTVVHGRGTGALRRAVRDYLAGQPQVQTVEAPSGDEAVTRVGLR